MWALRELEEKAPLVVAIDDFSRVLARGLEKVDLGSFLDEVGYLVV
jgi:hypothetical protein